MLYKYILILCEYYNTVPPKEEDPGYDVGLKTLDRLFREVNK